MSSLSFVCPQFATDRNDKADKHQKSNTICVQFVVRGLASFGEMVVFVEIVAMNAILNSGRRLKQQQQ